MNYENTPRKLDIAMSREQVNDAFTSLLLMTGYINEGDVITNVVLPKEWKNNAEFVQFNIEKESKAN